MKQILQNLGSGETLIADVPSPAVRPGHLLVRTCASLVSIGTERMLIDFGRAGWVEKARQQPDKVRQVIDKVKTDGLLPTLEAVRSKLDQPVALGYCNAGVVEHVGAGVEGFRVGDRVASNGPHAQVVSVPATLCASIPDGVDLEHAAFTVAGAIALQGIRLAEPTLGENVAVLGLGLIGLLAVQLLQAHGCRVIGIDLDGSKCTLARQFGAEAVNISEGADPVAAATDFSAGRGIDAVLITAATKSSDPVHQAAQMSRKRGRIVLVGVAGLELSRDEFYKKELSFQVSCSYGPGRYDENYEAKGQDYPIGFVRWTAQRNFEAVIDMMSRGRLDVAPLITHRFPLDGALEAYGKLPAGALGIVLTYPQAAEPVPPQGNVVRLHPSLPETAGEAVVGVIGAGGFTGQVLLPALKKTGARLKAIASSKGVSGTHLARKFGFEESTTDAGAILADPEINTVLITTRHDTHAQYCVQALRAGKRVYVEKPLAIRPAELSQIEQACEQQDHPFVMVGFNRRFSPHTARIKGLLESSSGPKSFIMTVNAGALPPDHWTLDAEVGGGRIIGEACHFIDLLRYLANSPIVRVNALPMAGQSAESMSVALEFQNGSAGTILYLANGHKSFPKERLDVFCEGRVLQLDNFRKLRGFGWKGFRTMSTRQDKGHEGEMAALIQAVREGRPSPIPFDEIVEVTEASFQAAGAAPASHT